MICPDIVDRPAASVIVLAYNAAGLIRSCLDALAAQICDHPFEVVVVWSGDPATSEVVEREYPWARLVGQPGRLRTGATRNLGLAHAKGDTVAFLAADCRVAPDWLARRIAAHDEGFRSVGGAVLCALPAGILATANHFIEYSLAPPGRPREVVFNQPIYNLSFRREVFEEYGAYDPTLTCGEDLLFNWRLVRAGESELFDPSVRMYHPGPTRWHEYLGHQFQHGQAFATLSVRPDYPGRRQDGPLAFLMVLAYPLVRLQGVFQRTARWDRKNLGRLVMHSPIVILGIAAASLGMAYGWCRPDEAA